MAPERRRRADGASASGRMHAKVCAALTLGVVGAGCSGLRQSSATLPIPGEVPVFVLVTGVQVGRGPVRCAVYLDRDAFLTPAGCAFGKSAPAEEAEVAFTFALPPGKEAVISAFQDLDGDEDLDRSLLGLPSEPWGFSGKPSRLSPPRWDACAFVVGERGDQLSIPLLGRGSPGEVGTP